MVAKFRHFGLFCNADDVVRDLVDRRCLRKICGGADGGTYRVKRAAAAGAPQYCMGTGVKPHDGANGLRPAG